MDSAPRNSVEPVKDIIMRGPLFKSPPSVGTQSQNGLFDSCTCSAGNYSNIFAGRWRRCYCSLYKLRSPIATKIFFDYYKDVECTKFKGRVDLEHCDKIEDSDLDHVDHRWSNIFSVHTKHRGRKRIYYFSAPDTQNKIDWVKCLTMVWRDPAKFIGPPVNLPSVQFSPRCREVVSGQTIPYRSHVSRPPRSINSDWLTQVTSHLESSTLDDAYRHVPTSDQCDYVLTAPAAQPHCYVNLLLNEENSIINSATPPEDVTPIIAPAQNDRAEGIGVSSKLHYPSSLPAIVHNKREVSNSTDYCNIWDSNQEPSSTSISDARFDPQKPPSLKPEPPNTDSTNATRHLTKLSSVTEPVIGVTALPIRQPVGTKAKSDAWLVDDVFAHKQPLPASLVNGPASVVDTDLALPVRTAGPRSDSSDENEDDVDGNDESTSTSNTQNSPEKNGTSSALPLPSKVKDHIAPKLPPRPGALYRQESSAIKQQLNYIEPGNLDLSSRPDLPPKAKFYANSTANRFTPRPTASNYLQSSVVSEGSDDSRTEYKEIDIVGTNALAVVKKRYIDDEVKS